MIELPQFEDLSVYSRREGSIFNASRRVISLNSRVRDVYTKSPPGSHVSAPFPTKAQFSSWSNEFRNGRNKRIIMDPKSIQQKLLKQNIIADRQRTFNPRPNLSVDGRNRPLRPFERVAFEPNTRNAFGFLSTTLSSPSIWNNVSCKTEIASLQGGKSSQEDVGIASSFTLSTLDGKTHKVFLSGIFDGHDGPKAALFMKDNLQKKLENTFNALFNKTLPNLHPLKLLEDETTLSDVVIWNVLKIACVELHEECRKVNLRSGTTAAFSLLINGEDLWHANIGDSRSFITSGRKTIQLSEDMKSHFSFKSGLTEQQFEARFQRYFAELPKDDSTDIDKDIASYPYNNYERSIWKREGFVSFDRRLNNKLLPARAIGDPACENAICPRPKITKTSLLKEFGSDDFVTLVHASDGLWDVTTTDEAAAEINSDQAKGIKLAETIKDLTYSAVNAVDPKEVIVLLAADNVTIVATRLDLRALRQPAQESNCSCIVS